MKKFILHIPARILSAGGLPVLALLCMLMASCHDDFLSQSEEGTPLEVVEGIEGELTLTIAPDTYNELEISTRASSDEASDQHIHSLYLFVIDRKNLDGSVPPEQCPIIARKYFSNVLNNISDVTEDGQKFKVTEITIPAVSCGTAQFYAIANLGYSDMQGVENEADMIEMCDTVTTLYYLRDVVARLGVNDKKEVNVERMQGHHLMSGFFRRADLYNYLDNPTEFPIVTIRAEADGKLHLYDAKTGAPYCLLGHENEKGTSAGIFVNRLDTKVTVRIQPAGALATTDGAYFRLTSWQVMNLPRQQYPLWSFKVREWHVPDKMLGNSKVFKRDLTETDEGGWEFTYYQFENYQATPKPEQQKDCTVLNAAAIAAQYNKEYGLKDNDKVTAEMVTDSFAVKYPNKFSGFAYGLRELKDKSYAYGDSQSKPYDPDAEQNNDTITVVNGDFTNAPDDATYVKITGFYYNPQEPERRIKDDPESMKFDKTYPIDQYPYWGEGQIPVSTIKEAHKGTRAAWVTYYVHLGYVGGGNLNLTNDPCPKGDELKNFEKFKDKLNDYNMLRNHHYTYTLKVAGAENIKLEATREDGGSVYEQENQPGAEGQVVDSRHFYDLDAHYTAINYTVDFHGMPFDLDKGFGFAISTPFQEKRVVLKKGPDGEYGLFDGNGVEMTSIRGWDMDWIHFAWHGDLNDPSRSLIDKETGNGVEYSNTYGGYKDQQTYRTDNLILTQEKDATHQHYLLNCYEFAKLVWRGFATWKAEGQPKDKSSMTFTIFVDEFYYDFNPVTNAQLNWKDFCNQDRRKIFFFMDVDEISADQQNWYTNSHLVIMQSSIQTHYATDNYGGQIVANVAYGIEHVDEFRAQYKSDKSNSYTDDQYFEQKSTSLVNGLYNTMLWYNRYKSNGERVIDWAKAARYFTEKCYNQYPTNDVINNNKGIDGNRSYRRGQWAIYTRNRDLNRNGKLDPEEIRWFVPAIDQYTYCFLGGRPVFDNPLYEKHIAVNYQGTESWLKGVNIVHFMSSTGTVNKNNVFWAEEGCTKGKYGGGQAQKYYGIRMARMLCIHGVESSGAAFAGGKMKEETLLQDDLYVISHTRNGEPVPRDQRVDGKTYYILLNKMNMDAFREPLGIGELTAHTHEEKQNWLCREYRIAKNKVGYKSYTNPVTYDRTPMVDGKPRTWYQMSGQWSPDKFGSNHVLYYRGAEESLAYEYREDNDGMDLHHWRIPNLREASILTMAFPNEWFFGSDTQFDGRSIVAGTTSANLGPGSTDYPVWILRENTIYRMPSSDSGGDGGTLFYVRSVQDVK